MELLSVLLRRTTCAPSSNLLGNGIVHPVKQTWREVVFGRAPTDLERGPQSFPRGSTEFQSALNPLPLQSRPGAAAGPRAAARSGENY
jgi:hypothetical protein